MDRVSVGLNEWLLRRYYSITPEKRFMNPDGTAHSRVFKLREKDNGQLSVDIKSLTTYESSIGNPEKWVLFEILNSEVLALDLSCFHDPLADGSNDAHAVIEGMDSDDEILPGMLARKSKRVHM